MRKNVGLSLIEVIVGIALFSVAILIIGTFFTMSQSVYTKTEITGDLAQNARIVSERLSAELKQAESILTVLPDESEDGVNEIFFRDGSGLQEMRHIKYYQIGDKIKRSVSVCYFVFNPDEYVSCLEKDEFENYPEQLILEDFIIAERAESFKISKRGDLILVFLSFKKGRESFQLTTEIYPRNTF